MILLYDYTETIFRVQNSSRLPAEADIFTVLAGDF